MFEDDELELNPESEEDLDVGEEEGEDVKGGAGTIGTSGVSKPKMPTSGGIAGPVPVKPGGSLSGFDPNRASTGGACSKDTPAQGCTACTGCE